MTVRTEEHGNNAYTDDRRCRCPECRAAHRRTNAERRAKAYAHTRKHGLPDGVRHGSSAYENWGCRCPICTTAATTKRAARAARKRHRIE